MARAAAARRDASSASRRSRPRARARSPPRPRTAPRWFQLYLLPRPRRHPGAAERGGRARLSGDRADRRRPARRPARARPAHRLRGPAEVAVPASTRRSAADRADQRPGRLRPGRPDAHLGATSRRWSASARRAGAGQGGPHRARTRGSRSSTAPPGSSSPTTAGASSTASPASLDALPEVVEAVEGRVEVLMDGGIRRGTDVLVALALGARAVLVGRPPALGARGRRRGRAPRRVLELLRDEIELALCLLGCPTPATSRASTSSGRRLTSARAYIRLRWPSGIHARRRCAACTAPGRCSRPPTATSARRSTTRSASSRSTRSG